MTLKLNAIMKPVMGRPPIGKFTAVRLSDEMLARIDAIAGKGKRAAFIRTAIENELEKSAQSKPKDTRKIMSFGESRPLTDFLLPKTKVSAPDEKPSEGKASGKKTG